MSKQTTRSIGCTGISVVGFWQQIEADADRDRHFLD
jgi:hypothetical protein